MATSDQGVFLPINLMGSGKIKDCREIKVGSTLEATSIARMINLIQMLSRSDVCIYFSSDRVRRVIAILFHTI